MRRCYIIVRQLYYMSNGYPHQIADENPVVAVYTTKTAAVEVVRDIIQNRIENSYGKLHSKEGEINSEVVYRLEAYDSLGNSFYAYSVIKMDMIV